MKINSPHYAQLQTLQARDSLIYTSGLGVVRHNNGSAVRDAGSEHIRARLIAASRPGSSLRAGSPARFDHSSVV